MKNYLEINESLEIFKKTPGAISVCEFFGIRYLASQAPKDGACVDVGSNAGKAAIATASALTINFPANREYYLVDPIFDLTNREAWAHSDQKTPENCPWPWATEELTPTLKNKLYDASDCRVMPIMLGDYSENALKRIFGMHGKFAWVFLDSDQHQYELVRAECNYLEDKMEKDGIIAFHDFKNQFKGPVQVYNELVKSKRFEEIVIPWKEIQKFVKDNDLEKDNDSWHMRGVELPCFVGGLRKL